MVEDKSVAEQTHEIINLEHALADAEMKLPKKFLAMSIMDKFPKSWENFGMTLKHHKGRLSIDDLMIAINQDWVDNCQWLWEAITGMMVSMGNSSTAEVLGIGSVDLKFPSGRVLLPKYLWGEALNMACHILNRVPLKHNTNTPFELWKGIEVNTIVEFRDAVFIEDVFPMKTGIPSSVSLDDSLVSTSIPKHVDKMKNVGVNPSSSTSLTHKESNEPRRSKRARVVKDFRSDFVTYNIEDDPVSFKDVMVSSEAKQWKEVIKNKMKARLVAKDFKQNEGIDYFDTYSLVARLTTIQNKFEMKDMVEADVILGIKLIRSIDGIAISQSHYVEKINEKFGYQNSRIAKTPYDSSIALFKNESGVSVAQLRYSQIIESLQYLANGTRPDILFSVSKLAKYTSCPDKIHLGALDRVLRYLKGTVSLTIHYGRFFVVLEGYSDAS
ncbi:hypothetical protein Sango_0011300 [Sesamum angolense]|uniref:Reverse transcriptase Ty1/copia-type domain-containing protein n=1 Tax=Sesamum angolense TaxID=2727404 RepID=A0AAE2C537_9LAMI|nr:hypothetical protein Sango_0011300 [Sesamum angolense]